MISTPKLHRDWLNNDAFKIVERLQEDRHESYLVGGCVRDLLLGIHPKDFDIATSASPNQIRKRIYNSYLIGRRFKLILVKRGNLQFEVATFRKNFDPEEHGDDPEIQGDNFFGTAEEDAKRRDFTINGIFYDPVKDALLDYVTGLQDIEARVIRMIGTPEVRLTEDPIRILRALRLAHKIDFTIEENLRAAMLAKADLILATPLPRRREEYLKILRLKDPYAALMEMGDVGVLKTTLPGLAAFLEKHALSLFDLMRTRPQMDFYLDDPIYAFAVLVVPMAVILMENAPREEIPKLLDEDGELGTFLKQELGVFKAECNILMKAIETHFVFEDIELFKKRGARRRRGFLSQEHAPLAFSIAKWIGSMRMDEQVYWEQEIASLNQPPNL